MQAAPKLCYDLRMGEPLFTSRGLGLGHCKFSKEFDSCFESLIMLNTHDHKIAFSVCGQINGLILFMTQGSDIPCLIAQA